MSERMWLNEQLEIARTERDQARLELAALRAAWKIAEPHLLYPIRRRCLAVLAEVPQ